MSGEGFWKKVTSFCLAFGLGVLLWSFLDVRENSLDKIKVSNLNNESNSLNKMNAFESYKKDLIDDLNQLRDEKMNSLKKNENLPNKMKESEMALIEYLDHQIKELEDLKYSTK